MPLKIQYNKTFSQELSKQLTVRERALPTLKSKETALRIEVKKAMDLVDLIKEKYDQSMQGLLMAEILLREFPHCLRVTRIHSNTKNIAGVKVEVFQNIEFDINLIHFTQQPAWLPMGLEMVKKTIELKISLQFARNQLKMLSYHRKKTTQKVNLYEKVQIPEFKSAILRIKRYLEDEENLQKAAQKIVKERHLQMDKVV